MAQDKFKRLLSRELSHISERSRSGHFVAEWVNTITGSGQGMYILLSLFPFSLLVISPSLLPSLTRKLNLFLRINFILVLVVTGIASHVTFKF